VTGTLHPATRSAILIDGYEIHLGETQFDHPAEKPFLQLNDRPEGYYGEDGLVIGTYLHHLFHNDDWRTEWLNGLRSRKGLPHQEKVDRMKMKEKTYDDLAAQLKPHLKWELIKNLMVKGDRE
ncbi:MAG: cobyric acid synthase CobQ, partial [Anaerobacillus sp.]